MKTRRRTILASSVLGIGVVVVYFVLDNLFEFDDSTREVVVSGIILASFLSFGLLLTRQHRLEHARSASEQRFNLLYERAPLGYQSLDRDGHLVDVNQVWLDTLGYSREGVIGRWFGDFLTPECVNVFRDCFSRLKTAGEIRGLEFGMIRHDGSRIVVAFDGKTDYSEPGEFRQAHCILTDITERKQTERALQWELETHAALAELSELLIQSLPIDEISYRALEAARRLTSSAFGFAGYLDPETGHLISPTLTRDIWDMCQVPDKNIVFETFSGLWGWVLDHRQPLLTNAPSDDPRSSGTPEGHLPIERFLSVPALVAGELVGQIALANADRDYTVQDQERIEHLAALYALAIQRHRTEEELRQSEAKFATIFRTTPDPITITRLADGVYIDVNEGFTRISGYTPQDVIGKSTLELNWTEPADRVRLVQALRTQGAVYDMEAVLRMKDGSPRICQIAARLIEIHGTPCLVAVVHDVTERVRDQEALRASQERLALALAGADLGLWDWNPQTGAAVVDERWAAMLGYTLDEIAPHVSSWENLVHPDDMPQVSEALNAHLAGRSSQYETEHRLRAKSGEWVYVLDRGKVVERDADGKPIRVTGTHLDITDRKRAEVALRRAEHEKESILDSLVEHVIHQDRDMKILWANRAACESAGMTREELTGRYCYEIWPQRPSICPDCPVGRAIMTGGPHEIEKETPDGRAWFIRGYPVRDEEGAVIGGVEVTLDVSDRKRAEDALKQYTTRLRVLHEIDRGILEAQSLEAIANAALTRIRELVPCIHASLATYDPETQLSTALVVHAHPDARFEVGTTMPVNAANLAIALANEVRVVDDISALVNPTPVIQILLADGIQSFFSVPLLARDELIGWLNVASDRVAAFDTGHIDLAREVAAQLAVAIQQFKLHQQVQTYAGELEQRVAERTAELQTANAILEQLGRVKDEFVANVSHELRTPITNLKLRQALLLAQPERLTDHLAVIERETLRLERIIDDLLRLSRLDQRRVELHRAPVDLNRLVAFYVTDRHSLAESRALRLEFERSPAEPVIPADEGLIGQVISVLLTNALNYTPEGGQVSVRAFTGERAGAPWAGFSVSDTGPGIFPEEMPRLFERFFRGTAAQESRVPGTGLGLALVREIVDRHGGHVEVHSDPGQGATFTVWLPASET
jgi:two-component system sensor histidine kinase/response regulator